MNNEFINNKLIELGFEESKRFGEEESPEIPNLLVLHLDPDVFFYANGKYVLNNDVLNISFPKFRYMVNLALKYKKEWRSMLRILAQFQTNKEIVNN